MEENFIRQQKRKTTLFQDLKLHSYSKNYELSNDIIKRMKSDGICLSYSQNDQFIAIGCQNGSLMIYNTKQTNFKNKNTISYDMSIASLKWLKNKYKKNNILVSSHLDGTINYWSTDDEQINTISKIRNQQIISVYCMDFNPAYTHLAVGSQSPNIHIFDQQHPQKITVLNKHISQKDRFLCKSDQIYTNRLRFMNDCILVSTCTDNTLNFWDLRQGQCVNIVKNTQIDYDCFDVADDRILTGDVKLQIRNCQKGKVYQQVRLDHPKLVKKSGPQFPHTARFGRFDTSLLGVGTICEDDTQLVIYKQDQNKIHKPILGISGVQGKITSLQFANQSQQIAFISGAKGFFVYDFGEEQQQCQKQQLQTQDFY